MNPSNFILLFSFFLPVILGAEATDVFTDTQINSNGQDNNPELKPGKLGQYSNSSLADLLLKRQQKLKQAKLQPPSMEIPSSDATSPPSDPTSTTPSSPTTSTSSSSSSSAPTSPYSSTTSTTTSKKPSPTPSLPGIIEVVLKIPSVEELKGLKEVLQPPPPWYSDLTVIIGLVLVVCLVGGYFIGKRFGRTVRVSESV